MKLHRNVTLKTMIAVVFMLLLFGFTAWSAYAEAWPKARAKPSHSSGPPKASGIDVLIDVGHGGVDGGTSYGSLLEKSLNLEIAQQLNAELHARGWRSVMNRTGDYALSDENKKSPASRHRRDLLQRKHWADMVKPKLMVSLHINWSSASGRHGGLAIHQADERSRLLAETVQAPLNRIYGVLDRPERGRTYFVLNQIKCPVIIIEMGYISNPGDRSVLTSKEGQREITHALADGIADYLQLTASNWGVDGKLIVPKEKKGARS